MGEGAGATAADPAPALDGDTYTPLYRRLHRTIARRIAARDWRPGEAIPSEAEFARIYDLAVGTVRKAIDALESDGLIERRHGPGTFVRRSNFNNSMMRFFLFRDSAGSALTPESHIVSRRRLTDRPAIARRLGLEDDAPLIEIIRHRSWDGGMRLLEDIYLPHASFAAILACPETEIGQLLYPAYERLCGTLVCFIEEEITIEPASREDARLLGLRAAEKLVQVERTALDALRQPLEWRRSRGQTDRFHYRVSVS